MEGVEIVQFQQDQVLERELELFLLFLLLPRLLLERQREQRHQQQGVVLLAVNFYDALFFFYSIF
jgi:hypothetical protein